MTKHKIRPWLIITTVAIVVVAFLTWWQVGTERQPMAVIRVVDAAGQPIAGAIIRAEGLRSKSGPYRTGWYAWRADQNGVSHQPVPTAEDGTATITYPKYVFEKIETGVICLSVDHHDFVPARLECEVDTKPPAGAPTGVIINYWLDRLRHRALVSRPDAVVLKKGGILRLVARSDAGGPPDAPLFAQVAGLSPSDTNAWLRPEPGLLVTRRLAEGPFIVRAVKVETNGTLWFSQVVSNTAVAGQTNLIELAFARAATVRGELDAVVPRPVRNGRVIAHVWPQGFKAEASPPVWHAWGKVSDDGKFEIPALPPGDLEIVALCEGFVSTNGAGKFNFRYPQNHVLGTNDLVVTLGMEPTARLEVMVTDDKGQPLKGARVLTWPNVRYGEWSATILASDCYNMVDWFSLTAPKKPLSWNRTVADFEGVSGSNGVAVLANLPATVKEFAVDHEKFALPAATLPGGGRKERYAAVALVAGETNHASVQLELINQAPITHY